jgi:hypothetical protein
MVSAGSENLAFATSNPVTMGHNGAHHGFRLLGPLAGAPRRRSRRPFADKAVDIPGVGTFELRDSSAGATSKGIVFRAAATLLETLNVSS